MSKFFEKYKNIHKSTEKNKHLNQAPLAFLTKCDEFNLLPSPIGMVSLKGRNDSINIKQYMIGNQYAEALSNGLKLSIADKINVSSNRLSH